MKTLLLLALLFYINLAQADIIYGRVVGVADGDTITILDSKNTQYKIRLSGIVLGANPVWQFLCPSRVRL